ncbi:hypothetical protein CR513_46420, partial [Mucuna pruriens]
MVLVATGMINASAQINIMSMLNEMYFKVWKEVVEIVIDYMDLDLELLVGESICILNNLQEVKIENWEHSNRMYLMIMKCYILEAF